MARHDPAALAAADFIPVLLVMRPPSVRDAMQTELLSCCEPQTRYGKCAVTETW